MAPKKGKKKVEDVKPAAATPLLVEEPVQEPDKEEPPQEEVLFTDTSYTSASFEDMPPPPVIVEEPKKKKKKKKEEEEVEIIEVKEFQWSEDSLPVPEEAKPEQEKEDSPKKTKKDKKKKKKEQGEKIPDFEKPKNWKSMDKKQQEKWLTARIEEWRAEVEAEKQAKLANAKENRARLARERAETMAREIAEQEVRRDILEKTCTLFRRFEKQKIAYENQKQMNAEWQQYLRCDGLPDPRVVTQMATYLHRWEETATYDVTELDKKCKEILPMLTMLEELVANAQNYTERQAANYNTIRIQVREQLAKAIEFASYHILRDIDKNLNFESVKIGHYNRYFFGLKLNIWVAVRLPTRLPQEQLTEPEAVSLEFPAIKVSVTLPRAIQGTNIGVRAAHSEIDLLSERTRSFDLHHELPNRYEDLFSFNVKELEDVQKLKKEQDAIRSQFYKNIRERTRELENIIKTNIYIKWEKEKEELDALALADPPEMPNPRDHMGTLSAIAYKKYLRSNMTRYRVGEVNMRQYRIVGGVLNLDLLVIPAQPKKMEYQLVITTLELPKQLKALDYKVQYRDPPPPSPGTTRTPEEIEAEIKRIEAEYQRLAMVHIELPSDVMWTEPPVICQWQEKRNLWTSNYINDYKYNEDKLTVQFRTGVLWPIGIATLRYGNLPYQGWEIKPDPYSKGVLVIVQGVTLTITWLCIGNKVKLKRIGNATTQALQQHINKKYSLQRMIQIMREAAVDFFPDFDGYTYVEGSCYKEWVMERHTYHAMAFLSRAYNFQWSRWNVQCGNRNLIMQFREAVDTKREGKLVLLHVTAQRAQILKLNEMTMNELDMTPIDGFPFYPDLFTLNMSYGSVDARRVTFSMQYKLVETVFGLLEEIKPLSFS